MKSQKIMENQKKTFETYLKSVKNLRNQRKSYEIMQKLMKFLKIVLKSKKNFGNHKKSYEIIKNTENHKNLLKLC